MKLATYQDGSRDGQLVVVSRDLSLAVYATHIANRLQQVLDDWNYLSPQLQDVYDRLNQGRARHAFPLDPQQCMAPLPRAYQWVQGTAYLQHQHLQTKASGGDLADGQASAPPTEPVLHRGASDAFLGACEPISCVSEHMGIDFAAGLAAITGDIPQACTSERALEGVRLLMLVNDVGLRNVPGHSHPATAFSPVAVTPDVLGSAWARGRVHLPLQSTWNGRKVGLSDAGADMGYHFGQLIASLCKVRPLRTGSIVGTGSVCSKGLTKGTGSRTRTEWPTGYHCIADKRAMEILQDGHASTEYMKFGDTIRIEAKGLDGQSVWGAIEQEVVPLKSARTTD